MPGKTVVILGGGVGGLVTANELRKLLGKDHRVVLVDKGSKHIFWPSLLWVQVGLHEPDKIVCDLTLLEKKGIDVVKGQVEAIDPEQRTIRVDGNELESDYLVVALGADLVPEQVPGLKDAGFNDRAILDINQIVAYFAYVNRVADGLGVELEDFWEKK